MSNRKASLLVWALLGLTPIAVSASDTPNPTPVSSDITLASAQMNFGIQFFQEIVDENPGKNVLVSPYSAACALGMAYNGAKGGTKAGMAKVLHLGTMTTNELNQGNLVLQQALLSADPKTELIVANSIWLGQDYPFKKRFLDTNQAYYQAKISNVDFTKPEAVSEINQWVSDNTKGKIPTLFSQLPPGEALVLANAVYFKGLWKTPFDPQSTQPGPFYLSDGSSPNRAFMFREDDFPYFDTKDFQAVSLPYGNGRLSLLVFLPRETGLVGFCKQLSAGNLSGWMGRFQKQKVKLKLPKFKVEFESNLSSSLSAMGMGSAFTPGQADFTGIAKAPLFINRALQKTYMLVDEKGTEAAAATGLAYEIYGFDGVQVQQMTVDHPFFIALVDNQTQALLFTGILQDPQYPESE